MNPDEREQGPVVDGLVRIEMLESAAVAVLDPLISDSDSAGSEGTWFKGFCRRVGEFSRTAREQGLQGLAYAASLAESALDGPDSANRLDRSQAEAWATGLIAFCGGQSESMMRSEWIAGLARWPAIGNRMNVEVVSRLDQRLVHDATLLDLWRASNEVEIEQIPVLRERQSADDGVLPATMISSEELDMLAQACQEIGDEQAAALAAWVASGRGDAELLAEQFDEYADRSEHLANAVRYLSLDLLAALFDATAVRIRECRRNQEQLSPAARAALVAWPQAWAAVMKAPAAFERLESALQLHALLASDEVPLQQAAAAQWRSLQLAPEGQLRPIERPDTDAPMSLAPDNDADPAVVAQLLRELPALSEVFSLCIERLLAGDRAVLESAQRAAHTLKGAANTVGISGIALFTHALEDLLELIGRREVVPDAGLGAMLVEAADVLAGMVDTVAENTPAPESMRAAYRSVLDWRERLAASEPSAPESKTGPTSAARREAAVAVSEPLKAAAVPDRAPVLEETQVHAPAEPSGEGTVPASGSLRVDERLIDELVDASTESSIAIAQLQAELDGLRRVRRAIRIAAQRTRDLSVEASRLFDSVRPGLPAGPLPSADPVSGPDSPAFDTLEMHAYDEFDMLANRIAEIGADAGVLESEFGERLEHLAELMGRLDRAQSDTREAALSARMISVSSIAGRLERAGRQAARLAGRSIEILIRGQSQRFEARLLQGLIEPLGHLIRNAVDHGIEPAEQRERKGKPTTGRIEIDFRRLAGGQLRVSCSDDGRGPDWEAIRRRAETMGLVVPAAEDQVGLLRVLSQMAFTTRDHATQLSGRGLGLALVANAVSELRGRLTIESAALGGLTLVMSLPLDFATVGALVLRSPSYALAISVASIRSIVPAQAIRSGSGGRSRILIDGVEIGLIRLEDLLGMAPGSFVAESDEQDAPDVVLQLDQPAAGIGAVLIPSPGAARQVIAQPLPAYMPSLTGVEGATVLADGAVAPVMDLRAWVQGRETPAHVPPSLNPPVRPCCLLVDDSVSVRRAMQDFVQDLGLQVESAADGIEALALLDRQIPQIAIIDLEMPRMNGLELTRELRKRPETAQMPILMISSRASDKHREHARLAGVSYFLSKPYIEDELAALIHHSLGTS